MISPVICRGKKPLEYPVRPNPTPQITRVFLKGRTVSGPESARRKVDWSPGAASRYSSEVRRADPILCDRAGLNARRARPSAERASKQLRAYVPGMRTSRPYRSRCTPIRPRYRSVVDQCRTLMSIETGRTLQFLVFSSRGAAKFNSNKVAGFGAATFAVALESLQTLDANRPTLDFQTP